MDAVRKAFQPGPSGLFSSRPGVVGISLAGLFLLAVAPVEAAQCPTGQIYRVSKKVCMDRAEAVKLGIVHAAGGKTAQPPKAELAPEAEPASEPERAAAPEPRGSALADSAAEPAPAAAPAPPSPQPAATPSPFGALTIENFSKP